MAESVMADPMPSISWPAVGVISAGLTAILVPVFNWFTSKRRNDIDESALILTKYKELADTFAKQVETLQAQFDSFKIAAASEKATMQGEIDGLRSRVRQLEEENSGLKAAIRQNSQSAAVLLQRRNEMPDDLAEKLDRIGDNIIRGMDK